MIIKKFNYGRVNSTNDLALKLIKTTRYKSGFITANSQAKGRGRHGNIWISKKGNLFVTIFFSLKSIDYSITKLSTINLNIIKKLLSMYTKEKIFIKKPNDIMKKNEQEGWRQNTLEDIKVVLTKIDSILK